MVEEYEACGILREPENHEFSRVVINPVNAWLNNFCVKIREIFKIFGKFRLVLDNYFNDKKFSEPCV